MLTTYDLSQHRPPGCKISASQVNDPHVTSATQAWQHDLALKSFSSLKDLKSLPPIFASILARTQAAQQDPSC